MIESKIWWHQVFDRNIRIKIRNNLQNLTNDVSNIIFRVGFLLSYSTNQTESDSMALNDIVVPAVLENVYNLFEVGTIKLSKNIQFIYKLGLLIIRFEQLLFYYFYSMKLVLIEIWKRCAIILFWKCILTNDCSDLKVLLEINWHFIIHYIFQ